MGAGREVGARLALSAPASAAHRLAAAAILALALAAPAAHAGSFDLCDRPREPSADEKDVLLRFGAVVRDELAASGHAVALIARSGLDLHRIHVRYSHAGVALRSDGSATPSASAPRWSVRELYYACDERRPRVFDEGLAGFLMGTDDPATGYVALLLMPPGPSAALARTALDKRQALGVLGATYSADAYPYSVEYQNCNQWVAELMAGAWGGEGDDPPPAADAPAQAGRATPPAPATTDAARARAQRWLYGQGYQPTVFTVSLHPMLWVSAFVPWLHDDDHPADELAANRLSVSMPSSIEEFVKARVPGTERLEICHAGRRVVVHRGWDEVPDGCVAGAGDRVVDLPRD